MLHKFIAKEKQIIDNIVIQKVLTDNLIPHRCADAKKEIEPTKKPEHITITGFKIALSIIKEVTIITNKDKIKINNILLSPYPFFINTTTKNNI